MWEKDTKLKKISYRKRMIFLWQFCLILYISKDFLMSEQSRTQASVLSFCINYLERWEKGLNPELPAEAWQVRRICTDLLNNYFRYRGFVKIFLSELTIGKKMQKRVGLMLELAITQLIFQRGISSFHAVNATVDFSKKSFKNAHGFVNGVLRNFIREHEILLGEYPLDELKKLFGIDYEQTFLGNKLYMFWRSRFSAEQLSEMIATLEREAPITVRMKKSFNRSLPMFLEPIDVDVDDCEMFVCRDSSILFSEYIDDFVVQDPATVVAASMVEAEGENRIIGDFCAAPGGKSVFIAERLDESSKLFSCDVNESRLETLEENLSEYKNVEVRINNALFPRFDEKSFDSILLDVPCSNSGVIRKRPDVKWRFSQKKLRELCQLQRDIFEATVPLIKDGGSIVYSTCSIESEENVEQVKFFLEQFPNCSLEREVIQMPTEHSDGAYAALIRVG